MIILSWFHPSDNRELLFYSHKQYIYEENNQYVLVR
jgi:hypothetical protein